MTIIYLLIANAIAHIISFVQLRKAKSPNATGVFVFIFVNAILAVLLWLGVAWAPWLVVACAIIGGVGLLTTTLIPKKGTWIDYSRVRKFLVRRCIVSPYCNTCICLHRRAQQLLIQVLDKPCTSKFFTRLYVTLLLDVAIVGLTYASFELVGV